MNDTNRGLNRAVILVVGALCLTAGAAGLAVAVSPAAAVLWESSASEVQAWIEGAARSTRIGSTTADGLGIAILAAAAALIVLLVLFLIGLGGRRSRAAAVGGEGLRTPLGRITVSETFASDALRHALGGRDDVLTSSVTVNDVAHRPVLHVSVTPRQSTNPRAMVDEVDRLVANLATLTGRPTLTCITVRTGLRARLAHDRRRIR